MHKTNTGWTGVSLPWTSGNKEVHEEIAASQVTHWTKKQIKAAEKAGYFESLRQRAFRNTKLGLLDELSVEME